AFDDVEQGARIGKRGRANLHGGGAGHQEFNGVLTAGYAAATDDRDMYRPCHVVDDAERYGLYRWTTQAASGTRQDRATPGEVDLHSEHRVDRTNGGGSLSFARDRKCHRVGHVWRELHDDWQIRVPHCRSRRPRRRFNALSDFHSTDVDVGTADVKFERGDAWDAVQHRSHFAELFNRVAGYVDDHGWLPPRPQRCHLGDYVVDSDVLQPDGVQHPGRCLGHSRLCVAATRFSRHAF